MTAEIKLTYPAPEQFTIESLDIEAQGIAHKADGKVVFIEGALPFEVVSANVHRKKSSFEQGTVIGLCELPESDIGIRWRMLFNSPIAHTAMICRKSACQFCPEVYDESFIYAQDYELWTRTLQHVRGANLPEPLMSVRFRVNSTSDRYFFKLALGEETNP